MMATLIEKTHKEKQLSDAMDILDFHSLTIHLYQYQVLRHGTKIDLSYQEFQTLSYLARHPGRVFTKEQIYQHVYQGELAGDVSNIIYCLIRSLRKKLEPDPRHPEYIHTVRGVGYKFEPLSGE